MTEIVFVLDKGFMMVREGPEGTQYHMNHLDKSVMAIDLKTTSAKQRERFFNGATIRISIELGSEVNLDPTMMPLEPT